jgi:hypothetical protein
LSAAANGARGYPERPASEDDLAAKFVACAERTMSRDRAAGAIAALRNIERAADVRSLVDLLANGASVDPAASA